MSRSVGSPVRRPRSGRQRDVAIGLLVALAATATVQPVAAAQSDELVLRNANLIDGTGAAMRVGVTIVVRDGRIQEIRDPDPVGETASDSSAPVVDVQGGYVLPGLWNNHAHLSDLLPDPKDTLVDEPLLRAAIRSGRNAMDAIRRGFTSLRMTGERDYIDVAWRDAFAAGVFVGPTIYAAGNPLAGEPGTLEIGVQGADDARRIVRQHVEAGVDLIKLIASRLDADEIGAAIETAHRLGVPVTAHADDEAARIAIAHGVDGIEHGYGLAEETLRSMAERGVFYDPTIVCNLSAEYIADRERAITEAGFEAATDVVQGRVIVAYADERSPAEALRQRQILRRAIELGVKITPGGDSNPLGEIGLLEIEQLVLSGMSEMQAVVAATRNSADMMGVLDEVGTLEPGKVADLIVVEANPLVQISNLRTLQMVLKSGVPVNLEAEPGATSFWKLYFLDES